MQLLSIIRHLPSVILLFLLHTSCNRTRKKAEATIQQVKEKVAEKAADARDKVSAHFDTYTPDTKFNKKRFKEFFGFWPTADVKNIYAYADEMGIDASYYFSFQCHDSTVQKIGKQLNMAPDTFNIGFYGGLNSNPTFWWDTSAINRIQPLSRHLGDVYSHLWYDKKQKKAWFLTYDM